MRKLALVGLLLLVPGAAFAQNGWGIQHVSGSAVMSEISAIQFRVTNNSSSTVALHRFTLQLNTQKYDVDGGGAPVGWVVTKVDRLNKQITYTSSDACPGGGLAPGANETFEMRVIGLPAASDQLGETFVTSGQSKTTAYDCSDNKFGDPSPAASWNRIGLSVALDVTPRTLDVPSTVTVRMTVLNRSTATQSGITPAIPFSDPRTAAFVVTTSASPASLSLAPEASGTISWTFRAEERGLSIFKAGNPATNTPSASNASVSGLAGVESLQVDVGSFPGSTDVFPSMVVTGDTITVVATASNNTPDPLTEVRPSTPTFAGTASVTLLSGPSPSVIDSLPAYGSASFSWTYRVTGQVAQTFRFTTYCSALRSGMYISSDPVGSATGRIGEHTVVASPDALRSGSTNRDIAYTVANGGSQPITKVKLLAPDSTYFRLAANPVANDTSGWTFSSKQGYIWTAPTGGSLAPGATKTFTVSYASIGTVTTSTQFSHKMELTQQDTATIRVEDQVTIFVTRTMPEVVNLVAISGASKNVLVWTNPSDHDGVLILRALGAAPNTDPVPGTKYTPGQTIGNATVIYSDQQSFANSYSDQSLAAGSYYYRVFNHDAYFNYAPGRVPSANGVLSQPAVSPVQWCYSLGSPTLQQPVAQSGQYVYTAGNIGAVTATTISTGLERWRPTSLSGAAQSRLTIADGIIYAGDQAGYGWALNAQNGAVIWKAIRGVLGDHVQAQPGLQLKEYAAPGYPHAGDLIFFATYNNAATNNRLFAVHRSSGDQAFAYPPGFAMDIVTGGMAVDYDNNRLWLPSWSNGGTQDSLHVISTVNGAPVARFALGDLEHGIVPGYFMTPMESQMFVTSNNGTVYGFDKNSMTQVWSQPLGAKPTSWVFPTPDGFVATTSAGVQRFAVSGSTVTALWSTPVANATGVTSDFDPVNAKFFVGSTDGRIHQLDATTGVDEKQFALGGGTVGMPMYDYQSARLFVGMLDGRLCSLAAPLP